MDVVEIVPTEKIYGKVAVTELSTVASHSILYEKLMVPRATAEYGFLN